MGWSGRTHRREARVCSGRSRTVPHGQFQSTNRRGCLPPQFCVTPDIFQEQPMAASSHATVTITAQRHGLKMVCMQAFSWTDMQTICLPGPMTRVVAAGMDCLAVMIGNVPVQLPTSPMDPCCGFRAVLDGPRYFESEAGITGIAIQARSH